MKAKTTTVHHKPSRYQRKMPRLSTWVVAKKSPRGEKETDVGGCSKPNQSTSAADGISKTRTVPSIDDVTSSLPSGLKACTSQAATEAARPSSRNVRGVDRNSREHTQTEHSRQYERMCLANGTEPTMSVTRLVWPRNRRTIRLLRATQMR